jgi:phosphoglycolate phosphatase-like HAD superfamily hydrolase
MEKNIVIVDIDGTLAMVGDRLKYLQQDKKDWDKFYEACYEDEPINEIVDLVGRLIYAEYKILYVTGRRESVRRKTLKWFKDKTYINVISSDLLMRKNNDYRHDTIIKPELIKEKGIDFKQIAFVLEDRNSVVKTWRDLGVKCLQVADSDF